MNAHERWACKAHPGVQEWNKDSAVKGAQSAALSQPLGDFHFTYNYCITGRAGGGWAVMESVVLASVF